MHLLRFLVHGYIMSTVPQIPARRGAHARQSRPRPAGPRPDVAVGHPHGLYLLLALATACGTDASGRSRTVWFRLDERDGQVPAELGQP
jgi:hypothetical protein